MELKTLMCERFFCSSYRTVLYAPSIQSICLNCLIDFARGDKDMEILFIYLNNKIKPLLINMREHYSFVVFCNESGRWKTTFRGEEYDTSPWNKSFLRFILILENLIIILTWTTWNIGLRHNNCFHKWSKMANCLYYNNTTKVYKISRDTTYSTYKSMFVANVVGKL